MVICIDLYSANTHFAILKKLSSIWVCKRGYMTLAVAQPARRPITSQSSAKRRLRHFLSCTQVIAHPLP
jgi:hypothetical protein